MANDNHKSQLKDASVQFMLAEFNRIQLAEKSNRDSGDRRINLYLTLISIIITGVIILRQIITIQKTSTMKEFYFAVFIALLFLLLMGIVILRLLLERWRLSIIYLRKLARIRNWFVEKDKSLLPYLVYSINDSKPSFISKNFLSSSLITLVIVLNSIFISTSIIFSIMLLFNKLSIEYTIILSGILCVFVIFLQCKLIKKTFIKFEKDKDSSFPSQRDIGGK